MLRSEFGEISDVSVMRQNLFIFLICNHLCLDKIKLRTFHEDVVGMSGPKNRIQTVSRRRFVSY